MFSISEIMQTAQNSFLNSLQKMTYETLINLQIPFERVNTDEVISMKDCVHIDRRLNMKMVKTLFLCNRQKTEFYLFITTADKPFNSKEFSNQLGVARISFASAELLESMLGVKIGAATIFCVLMDTEHSVNVVIDEDVATEEWYGCSDGTNTGYMKVKTTHIVHHFLTYTNHNPIFIQI